MTIHVVQEARARDIERRIDAEVRSCLHEFPHYSQSIRSAAAAIRARLAEHCQCVPAVVAAPLQHLAHRLRTTPEELWGTEPDALLNEDAVWRDIVYPLWLIRHHCERRVFPIDQRRGVPWYARQAFLKNRKLQ